MGKLPSDGQRLRMCQSEGVLPQEKPKAINCLDWLHGRSSTEPVHPNVSPEDMDAFGCLHLLKSRGKKMSSSDRFPLKPTGAKIVFSTKWKVTTYLPHAKGIVSIEILFYMHNHKARSSKAKYQQTAAASLRGEGGGEFGQLALQREFKPICPTMAVCNWVDVAQKTGIQMATLVNGTKDETRVALAFIF